MTAASTDTNSKLLVACTACGYDLAGLKVPGVCPECGGWNTLPEPEVVEIIPAPAWFVRVQAGWLFCVAMMLFMTMLVLSATRNETAGWDDVVGVCACALILLSLIGLPLFLLGVRYDRWHAIGCLLLLAAFAGFVLRGMTHFAG